MPNHRKLALNPYLISEYRYRELLNFCRQYGEKKQKLAAERGLSAITYSGMPHGSGTGDPTAEKAERAQKWIQDIELIEEVAKEVDPTIYQSLIANVTNEHTPFEFLSVPCGRRQFYEARRKFFYLLDKKKKG